jgi:aspartate-semialdehyde dehydrogenase
MTHYNSLKIAIVNPGDIFAKELISIIEERNFPFISLDIISPQGSEGRIIQCKNENKLVTPIYKDSFEDIDLAFFILNKEDTELFLPMTRRANTYVIDVLGSLRYEENIPLANPEINIELLTTNKTKIVCVPSSISIQLSSILYPIQKQYGLERVIVSTYQSVSSKGEEAIDQLAKQTIALLNLENIDTEDQNQRIAFNCLPESESIETNGYTRFENETSNQIKRLLNKDNLNITINSVTIPVFHCDGLSVNIETTEKIPKDQLKNIFKNYPCIASDYIDENTLFPSPKTAANRDEIFVGRIREDKSTEKSINLWCVMDNLRKGSALTAVRIAEELIELDIFTTY